MIIITIIKSLANPGHLFLALLLKGDAYLRFKIDWASLIVGRKFTVFALFYFVVFEGNLQGQAPPGAYVWRGLYMEGLIFGILRYFILNKKPNLQSFNNNLMEQ